MVDVNSNVITEHLKFKLAGTEFLIEIFKCSKSILTFI